MKRFILVAALVILAACTSSTLDFIRLLAGRCENAIRRTNSEFAANARSGNAQTIVNNFYAPDAVVMAPNLPALRGREAILQFWTGFLASGAVDLDADQRRT